MKKREINSIECNRGNVFDEIRTGLQRELNKISITKLEERTELSIISDSCTSETSSINITSRSSFYEGIDFH